MEPVEQPRGFSASLEVPDNSPVPEPKVRGGRWMVFEKKIFGGVGRGRNTPCHIVLIRPGFRFGFRVLRVTRFVTRFVTRRDEKNFRGVRRARFGLTTTAPRAPPTGGAQVLFGSGSGSGSGAGSGAGKTSSCGSASSGMLSTRTSSLTLLSASRCKPLIFNCIAFCGFSA